MGICLVMKNNLKRSLRHKVRWVIIFVMPLILSILTILINQIKDSTYRVGVIDSREGNPNITESTTNEVDTLCAALNDNEQIEAKAADLDTYHTDLILGTYHYVIDCSKGLSEEAVISTKSKKDNQKFFNVLMTPFTQVKEKTKAMEQRQHRMELQHSAGMLMSLFLIMSVLQGGMYLRDKSQGLMTRFCYAPQKKRIYMIGNLSYIFLITLIQVTASFLLLCLVNHTWLTLSLSIRLIGMITVVSSAFAILLCAVCKNDTQASISASSIAAIGTVISGMFVSIESMPRALQIMSWFSPIRWCMDLIKF